MFVAACSCSLMTLYVLIDHFYKFSRVQVLEDAVELLAVDFGADLFG